MAFILLISCEKQNRKHSLWRGNKWFSLAVLPLGSKFKCPCICAYASKVRTFILANVFTFTVCDIIFFPGQHDHKLAALFQVTLASAVTHVKYWLWQLPPSQHNRHVGRNLQYDDWRHFLCVVRWQHVCTHHDDWLLGQKIRGKSNWS